MVWNGYSRSQVYATHWNTRRTVPYCAPHYSKGAFFSWRRASLSWSGHDVLFIPQRMPCSLPMTSSMRCPQRLEGQVFDLFSRDDGIIVKP